jgi:hypothetical protein
VSDLGNQITAGSRRRDDEVYLYVEPLLSGQRRGRRSGLPATSAEVSRRFTTRTARGRVSAVAKGHLLVDVCFSARVTRFFLSDFGGELMRAGNAPPWRDCCSATGEGMKTLAKAGALSRRSETVLLV